MEPNSAALRSRLAELETEELQNIVETWDSGEYTDQAVGMAADLLRERGYVVAPPGTEDDNAIPVRGEVESSQVVSRASVGRFSKAVSGFTPDRLSQGAFLGLILVAISMVLSAVSFWWGDASRPGISSFTVGVGVLCLVGAAALYRRYLLIDAAEVQPGLHRRRRVGLVVLAINLFLLGFACVGVEVLRALRAVLR